MNTIQDLNNAGNVTFNSQADYAIVFGASAGNANISIDETATHVLQKQVPLTSITSPVRDVLIDVEFSGYTAAAFPITGLRYEGPTAGISTQRLSTSRWRVSGIRSVAQYDEAFANVTLGPATFYNNTVYSYNTTVSDQFGNTRTWSTQVNLLDDPTLSVQTLSFNEDTPINVANVKINTVNSTQVYVATVNVPTVLGNVGNATAGFANSFAVTGNSHTINAVFGTSAVQFWPSHDRDTSGISNVVLTRTGNATVVTSANVALNIGNTHNEFTMAPSIVMQEDTVANIAGFSITDIATQPPTGNAYTYTVTLSLGNTAGNLYNTANTSYANSFTITGNVSTVNSVLSANTFQYVPDPDQAGNVTIRYTQTSVEDSLVQANVLLPVNIIDHADFSVTDSYVVNKNAVQPVQFEITDLDPTVISYTVHIAEIASANVGEFFLNGVSQGLGNSSITLTGSKSTLNAANVAWKSYPDQLPAQSSLTYSQYKIDTLSGNIAQVVELPITITNGTTPPNFYLATTGLWRTNLPTPVGGFIRDRDTVYNNYRVRYIQTVPTPTGDPEDTGFFAYYEDSLPVQNARTGDTDWIEGSRDDLNGPLEGPWAEFDDTTDTFVGIPSNTSNLFPPIDRGSNTNPGDTLQVLYSQEKLVGNTWLPQATNVAVNLSRTGSNAQFTLQTTGFYTEDTPFNLTGTIVDPSYSVNVPELGNITWTRTWEQVLPDPSVHQPRWRVGGDVWLARGTANVSDSIIQIDPQLTIQYLPPLEYTGNVELTYTQTKSQEGNVYVQANVVPVTLAFAGGVDDFYFFPTAAGLVLTNNSFGNIQIVEPDPASEKAYTLTVSTASTAGNIVLGGVDYGNAANITGNAAQITSAVSTGYWAAGSTAGNVDLAWNITRTAPDTLNFVNESRTLTITTPAVGQAFKGGFAVGEFDSTGANGTPDVYLVVCADVFSPTFNFFSTSNLNLSTNSTYDGANNSSSISSAHGNSAIAVNNAQTLVSGGESDWYLPSLDELTTAITNLNSQSINSGSLIRARAYWHSTVANIAGQNQIGAVSYDSTLGALPVNYTQTQGVTFNAYQTAFRKVAK